MPTYSVSEVLLASARTNAENKGCREDHDPSRLDPVRTKSTFSVGHFVPENIASTKEKVCCSAASPRATESANCPWGLGGRRVLRRCLQRLHCHRHDR